MSPSSICTSAARRPTPGRGGEMRAVTSLFKVSARRRCACSLRPQSPLRLRLRSCLRQRGSLRGVHLYPGFTPGATFLPPLRGSEWLRRHRLRLGIPVLVAGGRVASSRGRPPACLYFVPEKNRQAGGLSLPTLYSPLPAPSSGAASGAASGRSNGNKITSRMEREPVSSITRRSMPMPSPAVGGMP